MKYPKFWSKTATIATQGAEKWNAESPIPKASKNLSTDFPLTLELKKEPGGVGGRAFVPSTARARCFTTL